MLLTAHEFSLKAEEIARLSSGEIGFDFETTGLRPYQGSLAFLMGFTDPEGQKFSVKLDHHLKEHGSLAKFFSNSSVTYCAHNAKFELAFLHEQFEVEVLGSIWDTEVMARVENNNHLSYSLQNCALRLGDTKYKPMLEWLKTRGNKGMYHLAPDEIILPYCEHDAWLSWRLRKHQVEVFTHYDRMGPKIKPVVTLEKVVLPHLFDMERRGLLVDVSYCKRAVEYEKAQVEKARAEFLSVAGAEFVDSRKCLQPVFEQHGIPFGTTEKGNASFADESLSVSANHPVTKAVLAHRRALKRLSSYWENFIDLEHNGLIHPSINQNRAQTGRMSISDPSCQNWATDEDPDTQFPIRRAFVAREGCVIASLDYAQMELRKGADEAEDHPLIERIQGGADLHQEVADIAGVPRSLAKNGRFAKQYGAGIARIATTLGVSRDIAKTISEAIDQQAKAMTAYSRMLAKTCRPFGIDWLGRRFYFDHGFEYKAFNYRIQGGCAEILKIAICNIGEFLKKAASEETFMIIPIHDEVVLNMAKTDLHLLPEIKRIMIESHRDKKSLGMDVSIGVGPNFHDLEEWSA